MALIMNSLCLEELTLTGSNYLDRRDRVDEKQLAFGIAFGCWNGIRGKTGRISGYTIQDTIEGFFSSSWYI
jgi:hypothetical protein